MTWPNNVGIFIQTFRISPPKHRATLYNPPIYENYGISLIMASRQWHCLISAFLQEVLRYKTSQGPETNTRAYDSKIELTTPIKYILPYNII